MFRLIRKMTDFEEKLTKSYKYIEDNKDKLPELFCIYENSIRSLPNEVHSADIQKEVSQYFLDMNKRVEAYNEQYQVLVEELGVLCTKDARKSDTIYIFFQGLLNLFQLAYSVYVAQPQKLQPFDELLGYLVVFFETKKMKLEGDLLQKALLLQLTKSAWALTSSQQEMKQVAKQTGGKLKRQTRKRRY